MRRWGSGQLFSATDLASFLACRHLTNLEIAQANAPAAEDAQAGLLRAKGLEHEQAILAAWEQKDLEVTRIDETASLADRAAATREAMERGAACIHQATLVDPPWHGVADFLRRVEPMSGPYSYEAVEVKLARAARPTHVLQLCVYSELLAALQGHPPHSMHLVLGNREEVTLRFQDFRHVHHASRASFERFVEAPPDTYPRPCTHCELCRWRAHCEERWARDDHLSQVANIRGLHVTRLEEAGVWTMRELASLPDGARVPRVAPPVLARLRAQARLQIRKRETGKDAYELLELESGRGFARLPPPDLGDLFFDIEGDPHVDGGLEYLFGIYHYAEDGSAFVDVWAHDHGEEKRSFEQVVDFIVARLKSYPRAHVYHYNHYEETALKRLASQYATREAQVDDMLRTGKLVDLYKVVREGLRVSEPRYSLKNLETFYQPKRTADVATAADSIVVYETWRATGDDALLEQIRAYNEADCRSTFLLRGWLLDLRPDSIPWPATSEDLFDAEAAERREARERIRQEVERRLLDQAASGEEPGRALLAHLLEFHHREDRPVWWAMFDRQTRTDEELVDDADCLGDLTPDPHHPPRAEKRSTVYAYCHPPQESKLHVGDRCLVARTLEPAGTLAELDPDTHRVGIKRGDTQSPLPERLSLIPPGPLEQTVLREALYRVAETIITGSPRFGAVRALLRRDLPVLDGRVRGTPVADPAAKAVAAATAAVERLRESYLLIQGPPGTGKTYTASRVIVELLAGGRRVGVMSSSHKAIHNLLESVETVAAARGLAFRGIKKSTSGRPDSLFAGRFVTNVTSPREVDPTADLLAGTAWLFARPELDEVLDVLFLDEAGQVSLANVVAAGTSARNLVLVGDQMQLGQPLQGSHPGGSGASALEHLLGDRATVPPERGLFLETTWRLHPTLCRFISEAVYDGRLIPQPENGRQRLLLKPDAHPGLAEAGLRFVPVHHEGCARRSEHEGRVVRALYESLLRQRFCDRQGREHAVTAEDVLVVAPYNVQVHHLKHVLPEGARVGTVDKFQGQEAEVVLVSMTTSSAEELPRNVEFLYSKNRLNVAISRARCLAVIVASPRLLEIPCRTVEEMQLVDTLCWARDFAG